MKQPVMFNYSWSKPFLPTGGAENIYLLIEARGVGRDNRVQDRAPVNLGLVLDRNGSMSGEPLMYSKQACRFVAGQMSVPDIPAIVQQELRGLLTVAAQNAKLKLIPSDGTRIVGLYGYPADIQQGHPTIRVGDLHRGDIKFVLVELCLRPQAPGEHHVLQLYWEYMDTVRNAAACSVTTDVQALFTSDVELLNLPGNPEVVQQVELTKSAKVIEEAMAAFDRGDTAHGQQLLKRQADQMLRLSVMMNNRLLAEESAKLYSQLDNFELNIPARSARSFMRRSTAG